VTVTTGLMSLVYGLVQAPTYGWGSNRALPFFIASALLLITFVINESRAKHPLIPLRIFKIRNVSGADGIMIFQAASLFSVFFFSTLYLQDILGYSPVKTGLSFLIVPIAIAIAATNVPRLIRKIGFKPILMVAPLFVSGGLFWLSHITIYSTYWADIAPGITLMGLGMGATFVSVTIGATSGVSRQESGLASGLLNTSQQVGGSLGLAILTGVAVTSTTRYLKGLNLHEAPSNLVKATATVHGFHEGYLIASTFGICASLLAALVIRSQPVQADAAHSAAISAG
jgi:predicted MFS family arabinose efflux permease